jgi:hypothetical protein
VNRKVSGGHRSRRGADTQQILASVVHTARLRGLDARAVLAAAMVQARLYQVGHERDPSAPMRSLHDFTPPLVGPAKVGNFTVWSFPHIGGVLLVAAAVLSLAGIRKAAV